MPETNSLGRYPTCFRPFGSLAVAVCILPSGTSQVIGHYYYIFFATGRRPPMLWTLAIILLILWAVGLAFKVAGALIHLLLVIALIVVLFRVFKGRKRQV